MKKLINELEEKRNRLQELLNMKDWNKDEVYGEFTWQDDLSWEYGTLIDDINELEEKISNEEKNLCL